MTDPKPNNVYNVDQSVSCFSYFDAQPENGDALHISVTNRFGASVEQIVSTTMNHIEALSKLRAQYPRPVVPVPDAGEPVRVSVDENGNEVRPSKFFTADEISVDMHDNKLYAKVKGKPFTQYGVPVWPEVLEPAGLKIVPGEPAPDIKGWKAEYVEKEGKEGKWVPAKVISLTPPQ